MNMKFGVTGIVINGFDQILLIKRNDTKTWAAPAGSLEAGELLTEAVTREVKEETGVKVMPVRMVAMRHMRSPRGNGHIQFVYRCMEAGGELTTTEEAIEVGYAKTGILPRTMLSINREQINQAAGHTGEVELIESGFPWRLLPRWLWLNWVVYPQFARERKAKGEEPFVPSPHFSLTLAVVVRDQNKKIIWVQKDGASQHPQGPAQEDVPPWKTAAEIVQAQLGQSASSMRPIAVLISKTETKMVMVWEAQMTNGEGQADIPADATEQAKRFAEMVQENNNLVRTEWL